MLLSLDGGGLGGGAFGLIGLEVAIEAGRRLLEVASLPGASGRL